MTFLSVQNVIFKVNLLYILTLGLTNTFQKNPWPVPVYCSFIIVRNVTSMSVYIYCIFNLN